MATAKLAYLVQPKNVTGEAIVEFREHELPTPGPGEILVKVEGAGICGTFPGTSCRGGPTTRDRRTVRDR